MDIYTNWKFISEIPINAKPCFQDKTLTYIDEWFVTFKRRWKGEKGEKGVIYLKNLIAITKKEYDNLRKEKKINELEELKHIINNSIIGIENLIVTYTKDGQPEVAENYRQCKETINQIINIQRKGFFNSYPELV